jgi:hypothetical protein
LGHFNTVFNVGKHQAKIGSPRGLIAESPINQSKLALCVNNIMNIYQARSPVANSIASLLWRQLRGLL